MSRKIVTLGASAGGLAALEAFFKSVPDHPDCSFVIVQHLSPDFKSLMSQLLTAYTKLPIMEVTTDMEVTNNHIYLIPAGCLMTIEKGKFTLHPRSVEQMPINAFMKSAAKDFGDAAIGVILSGTGTDGTEGCQAIRDAGGLIIAQEPSTAEFASMPQSIIRNAYDHYTIRPSAMWPIIEQFRGDLNALSENILASGLADNADAENGLEYAEIFRLLKRLYQLDFNNYKIASVNRRIERRMSQLEKASVADYLHYIVSNREESDALYQDLLIGVTEFFRDSEAFEELASNVIKPALSADDATNDYRIWITGCASGEEAYTIAMITEEIAREVGYTGSISIFATDIHKNSIEKSGNGVYTKDQVANLSPERLNLYFKVTDSGAFKIKPEIRQRVVFAQHNLLVDPPFTKMDLVTCRNLLIYLKPEAQDSVIRSLHYALKMGGTLFMGSSESLGDQAPAFKVLSSKNKIFRKRADIKGYARPTQLLTRPSIAGARNAPNQSPATTTTTSIDRNLLEAYDLVLKRYAPTGVLIDRNREVRHFFGETSNFITPPEGRADSDFLAMLSGDLKLAVSTTLQRVLSNKKSIRSEGISSTTRHGEEVIDITVTPYIEDERDLGLILITFEIRDDDTTNITPFEKENFNADTETYSRILILEDELRSTKENLQATVEELQTSNEELQAINEEVQVSNEELQSTNEELHSMNEELYTVNAELEQKNLQLLELNDDHENLLTNTEDGVLYIDSDLRIKKFNPAIGFAFNLLPQDIGRPIQHIAYNLEGQSDMLAEIQQVLSSGIRKEREIQTSSGITYLRRFTPFLGYNNEITGVVLTFTDITEVSQMRSRLRRAMKSARMAWWEWDVLADRLDVHAEGECILGYDCETIDRTAEFWFSRVHPDDLQRVQDSLNDCLEGRTDEWNCEHRYSRADHSTPTWEWVHEVGYVSKRTPGGKAIEMLGTTMNINDRKLLEIDLWTSKVDAERALEVKNQFLSVMSHEIRTPLNGINGMADLISQEIDDPAFQQHVEILSNSSHTLLNLISQILDYTKIQSGTMELSYTDCDIEALVETVLKIISHGSPSQTVKVDTTFALSQKAYGVDQIRLRQVLINIVGNALKFTGDSGHVSVKVSDNSDKAGQIDFVISDEGVGIKKDYLDRLFSPFSQQDSSSTRKYGGVGIGLTVSREIIELMGGTIHIDSEEDKGTTVTFSIMSQDTSEQTDENTSQNTQTEVFRTVQVKKSEGTSKVLLVDDDASNRLVLKKMIIKEGFEPICAASIEEAEKLLSEHDDFDIAFLDLHLPSGSGFDIVNHIREESPNNPHKSLPTYACTADASMDTRKLVKASKFDGLLIKPLRLNQLSEILLDTHKD